MQYLIYLIFRCTVFVFQIMPFRMIYAVSDAICFLVFRVARYRREVVDMNLRNSFPEKPDEEIRIITKEFYHHFCDVLLESMKVYSMPVEKVVERYRFTGTGRLDQLFEEGRPVICVTGHYNNWEWGGIASEPQLKHRSIGFYKPLSNKYIDAYIARNRARGRNRVASIERTQQTFKDYADVPSLFYMIADQSPPSPRLSHWVRFMNQDTAVLPGPDRYARMLNLPVTYAHVRKIRRGWYEVEFVMLIEDSSAAKTGEITEKYMNMLEKAICEKPAYYLWSHRRWKHKKPQATI